MESAKQFEVEIWAVRHVQTFDNLQHLCQGHQDGKLTPEGEQQALVLGERLAKVEFCSAYVSDLGRTKATFQNISSKRTASISNVNYEPLLREKSGGVFEGKPLKQVADAAKTKNIPVRDFRPNNGESWKDVYARASLAMKLIFFEQIVIPMLKPTENSPTQPKRVLIVSHGGWIMELLNYIRFKEQAIEPVWNNSSRNCCVNIISMKLTAKPENLMACKSPQEIQESMYKLGIVLENDISHFEGTTLGDRPKAPTQPKPET